MHLKEHIDWRAILEGRTREEIPEIPVRAITEAVVNSLPPKLPPKLPPPSILTGLESKVLGEIIKDPRISRSQISKKLGIGPDSDLRTHMMMKKRKLANFFCRAYVYMVKNSPKELKNTGRCPKSFARLCGVSSKRFIDLISNRQKFSQILR